MMAFCSAAKSMDWPSWVSAIAASVGVVAAGIGILNARQANKAQEELQKRQLQQNLFDRRYAVFQAVEKLTQAAWVNSGDFTDEILHEYMVAIGQRQFLFRADVAGYLERVKTAAIDLRESARVKAQEERTSGRRGGTCAKETLSSKPDPPLVEFLRLAESERLKYFGPYLQLVEPTSRVSNHHWWQRRTR